MQTVYTLFFIRTAYKLPTSKLKKAPTDWPSVSLIICAKNEAENLSGILPSIVSLDYPHHLLEIILVNDQSSDATLSIMQEYAEVHNFIKVLTIDKNVIKDLPGKKQALLNGIQHAQNEWILLTDADCIPAHPSWINEMVSAAIQQQVPVVLGYGAYEINDGFLNDFIQFETLHTAMQYFSYSDHQNTYMGVGRNLLYNAAVLKDTFKDEMLLDIMRKTVSGDDDLVISHLAQKYKIGISLSSNSFTISKTVKDWKSYFKQKSRHSSSSKYYPRTIQFLLGLYALTHLCFWLGSIIGVVVAIKTDFMREPKGLFLIITVLVLVIMKFWNYHKWRKILKNQLSFINLMFVDFFWCIYNVILSPYIFWKNKQKWN